MALPPKDGIKADSEFEAKCRAIFDKTFNQKSQPGVPSGDVTAGGVTYTEDVDMSYCNIVNLLVPAMKKAGKNPTWDKVYKNLISVEKGPAAYMSNGEGGFARNKPYFANQMHMMRLSKVDANTPKAADGTYNGCPSPFTCWIPVAVDGKEWYPISGA